MIQKKSAEPPNPFPDDASPPGANHARQALFVGFAIAGLALVHFAFVAFDTPGNPEPVPNKFEQIKDFMPRREVETILGAATVSDIRLDHLGGTEIKIDILEWHDADGRQRIRIEFVNDKVIRKELEGL